MHLRKYIRKLKYPDVCFYAVCNYENNLESIFNLNYVTIRSGTSYTSLKNAIFGARKLSYNYDIKYIYIFASYNKENKGLFTYIQNMKTKELKFIGFYDLEKVQIFK